MTQKLRANQHHTTSITNPAQERRVFKWFHRFFKIGVWLKGLDGVLETIGGILFLWVSRSALYDFVIQLTRHELLEDPDDWIANSLRHAFGHLSASGKLFGSIYLLVHGVVKLVLVISLLRGKLWAFPTTICVLVGLIGYQVYRLNTHFTWMLFCLTMLDIVIVMLIWHEYACLKRSRSHQNNSNRTKPPLVTAESNHQPKECL